MNIRSYRGSYDVYFTSVPELIEKMTALKNTYVIVDKNVFDLYEKDMNGLFGDKIHIFDAVEDNKTMDSARIIIEKIAALDSRKETNIIAIGGGITQDVSCFVASILYRGVNWHFVPTTLLAQTDSCIGSKSSLNLIPYKNLLGTFYPPKQIFICMDLLKTLPDKEYYSGLGEIAKCALLGGKEDIIEFSNNLGEVLKRNYEVLQHEIERTLTYKKGLIEVDEFDMGVRNLLNFGHTFGHAIESASKYKVPHGQAVSIGLLIANNVSLQRGFITDEYNSFVLGNVAKILSREMIREEFFDPLKVLPYMKKDKKYQGRHNCILLDANGANKYPVSETEIGSALLRTYRSLIGSDI